MSRQIFPDTYSVPVRIQAKRPNTNPRYRHFTQTHFTAGDEEQFEQHHQRVEFRPRSTRARESTATDTIWKRYLFSYASTRHTFQYLFYKFKKGIFLQIRNGRLLTFLPFSNAFFVNEWSDRLILPDTLVQQPNVLPVQQWYSNNGLFRYEAPCNETDTGACQMKNMFEELCAAHGSTLPDVDLFINRRDFPLLKTDGTEPYHHLYDREDHPLCSHQYEAYTPVLSSCVADGFADLPIPTMDDWTRVQFKHGIHFASTKRAIATQDAFTLPWTKKRELAVFRGSATGIGYDAHTNPRIKLCTEFQNHPRCNVGITAWNSRYRKYTGDPHVRTLNPGKLALSAPLTFEEQAAYKYIIHVEGHVQAYRLSIELAMRSVILLVQSRYRLWYEPLLQPWVHYVPVAADFSDLSERIDWCLEHDEECRQIAEQARAFYDTYLTKSYCLEYLSHLLRTLSDVCTPPHTRIPRPCNQRSLQQHLLRKGVTEELATGLTTQRRVLFQNANTTVTLFAHRDGRLYVHKTSTRSIAKFEHEQFVGVLCVNRLLQHVPNFVYTPPVRLNRGLYLEYVPGKTLFDYLRSPTFRLNDWMFYMMQCLLAVGVGQRLCFFAHHDLCPWNIVLQTLPGESVVDYFLAPQQVYRIYTSSRPILIDYDKSHVVYNLQRFTHFFEFEPYQDALCLMVSCAYNILRYQRLSPDDERILLQLFQECVADPTYCPLEGIPDLPGLVAFLDTAHRYAHITFAHKGDLRTRPIRHMVDALLRRYQPTRLENTHTLSSCERVEAIHYRYLGQLKHPFPAPPSALHPLLELYWKQRTTRLDELTEFEIRDDPISLGTLRLPRLDTLDPQQGVYVLPPHYLEYWNMLLEMVHDGGPFQLLDAERTTLLAYLKDDLNTRAKLLVYAKHLVNFKISRNIL